AGGLPQHVMRQKISELIGPQKTQAFYTAWLDNDITKADIDAMAGWGFNSIRLPMHYNLFTPPVEDEAVKGRITWREDGFRRLDELLKWCAANHIYLILDLHAAPGGEGNDLPISDRDPSKPSLWQDPANQDKMVALWAEIARRYKDNPWIGGYDLLNEPNWGFQKATDRNGCAETGNTPLQALYERTTRAIRATDRNHMIIIEGNCWCNNYDGMNAGFDDNLALSFHKYWNYTTKDTIQKYLDLRDHWNKPLWMGESGENSNEWFAANVRLAEDNHIGWSWWPLKKFGFNNPLQIKPNPGVKAITDYWAGKGPKPAADDAYAALMHLATHDIRFENNEFHPDVVDALFRAPFSDATLPYRPHVITASGGEIQAADYDMGRDGTAYHDTTSGNYSISTGGESTEWNDGSTYRNDGVDIARYSSGQPYVSQMQAGEWLRYTLTADRGGVYDLTLPAGLSAELNGQNLATLKAATLEPGRNTLIVRAERNGVDLSVIGFAPSK
ncbi:MAG: cellulase family glycosylhydrolase, partial [Asticcacaulis sp.]